MERAHIGVVGGAVMSMNLALNIRDHGYRVALHNRTMERIDKFLAGAGAGGGFVRAETPEAMVAALESPRLVLMLVKAGKPVDETIEKFLPHLAPGDVLIDAGNSNWQDTERRFDYVTARGIHYIGTGVSGGEEGARNGPAIMPGGSAEAWPLVKPIFQAIAAKVGDEPCCDWIGPRGAGHFVKMVHNGIEYGDMQLICEAYHLMKVVLGLSETQIAEVFREWNQGPLSSYLIEIAGTVLAEPDTDGEPLVTKILDKAGQKGTGAWTVSNAAECGAPVTLIAEALFARCVSALKEMRLQAAKVLPGPPVSFPENLRASFVEALEKALLASKISSYAQGYMLMKTVATERKWPLNYGSIASIWRGGCIIRSVFLGDIKSAYEQQPELDNLLLAPAFADLVKDASVAWRWVVSVAINCGIPVPAFASALSFYDGIRSPWLPANLLQGLRDLFGAHNFQRTDDPTGAWHHHKWAGQGGDITAQAYVAR